MTLGYSSIRRTYGPVPHLNVHALHRTGKRVGKVHHGAWKIPEVPRLSDASELAAPVAPIRPGKT